jgi:hypothetical protein
MMSNIQIQLLETEYLAKEELVSRIYDCHLPYSSVNLFTSLSGGKDTKILVTVLRNPITGS